MIKVWVVEHCKMFQVEGTVKIDTDRFGTTACLEVRPEPGVVHYYYYHTNAKRHITIFEDRKEHYRFGWLSGSFFVSKQSAEKYLKQMVRNYMTVAKMRLKIAQKEVDARLAEIANLEKLNDVCVHSQ